MPDNLRYWLGFNRVTGIGPVRLQALIDHFGDVRSAWEAPETALRQSGLSQKVVDGLLQVRAELDLEAEQQRINRLGFLVRTLDDADYPTRLRQIDSAPTVLYCWAELRPEDEIAAAIVGTRRATAYGRAAAGELAGGLAVAGVTIVSGLARGIDAAAHKAALDAGGRTIAVLGSGLDHIYPPEHRKLAGAIAQSGAVVSDYPLGTRPEGGNFPPRNRIISGLSLAVIVVEAGDSSGALITANFAADQGRDVFAVPGRIHDRASRGTNRLIAAGAFPALSVDEILEVLNLEAVADRAPSQMALPEDETERKVLTLLSAEPIHIDELSARSAIPIAELNACLSMLELRGQARQVGGMHYVRARETGASYRVG